LAAALRLDEVDPPVRDDAWRSFRRGLEPDLSPPPDALLTVRRDLTPEERLKEALSD
jgi:hypothetical protein